MSTRNINYYLLKLARLSGWLLLPLVVLYIVTGFVLCRKFGFHKLMSLSTARLLHQIFDWPLLVVFAVHVSLTVYFSLRRWGWIGRRNCP